MDNGTEAEALNDWWDGNSDDYDSFSSDSLYFPIVFGESKLQKRKKYNNPRKGKNKSEKANANRYRCLVVGCNPKMFSVKAADYHTQETEHRTAKWPVRSAAGKKEARERNQNGYYDKYNVGDKSYFAREQYLK